MAVIEPSRALLRFTGKRARDLTEETARAELAYLGYVRRDRRASTSRDGARQIVKESYVRRGEDGYETAWLTTVRVDDTQADR